MDADTAVSSELAFSVQELVREIVATSVISSFLSKQDQIGETVDIALKIRAWLVKRGIRE